MRIVAVVGAVWVAWRWVRFAFGLVEIAKATPGPERRHVRRAVISAGAWGVSLTVVVVLIWMAELGRQPGTALVGFLAATVMCSLVVGVIAKFASAAEEPSPTEQSSPTEHIRDRDDGGTDHDDDQRREDAEQ